MNGAAPKPRIPVSTYRLQFNRAFTFRQATGIIDYLHALGISEIYASPYFRAKAGSLHGYDIVDHNSLSSEIGTEEDYRAMIAKLKRHDIGQILDIVPNHMCIECSENAWWQDVLENGPGSPYASYFDIDWTPVKKELKDKVLIPILGDQYGNVLESQGLTLMFEEGAFFVYYYDHKFPLQPQTYTVILEHHLERLTQGLTEENVNYEEYLSIIRALKNLPSYMETAPARIEERHREKEVIKRRLLSLVNLSREVRLHINENVRLFNGTKGDPRSFDLLDNLLSQQIFRLSHWRVATEEINYRRFFDINGLGAVRMERPDVFRATHRLILRMVQEGGVTGIRIDHPDGLYNPVEYFHRLQRGCFVSRSLAPGVEPSTEEERELAKRYDDAVLAYPAYKPFYIVGEKILTKAERMPEDWPIFSTTGYVFLNSVNGIFIDNESAKAFDAIYEKFIYGKIGIQEIAADKKKLVMQVSMASEMNTLGHYLNDLSEKNRHTRDFTLNSLRNAVIEVVACFPVYRSYTNTWSVSDRDRQVVELAVSKAKRRNPAISESIFDFVKDVLLLRFPPDMKDDDKAAWLDFVMRFQQITGSVMARGVEDTAFYVYNRLVSLNEVGGAPERFGTPIETFHGQNIERWKSWPHALITTATHDTKRGEDTRQRINVLSEFPRDWAEHVKYWARTNKKKKTIIDGIEAPDRNDEYLLYQTLIGAWPPGQNTGHSPEFIDRIRDYMLKASREAKVNTSWISPNTKYEEALSEFIAAILNPKAENRFLEDFLPFQRVVSHFGMFNSLSQTLLKIASPGVPDFYQGTELWDFSLVDPDNRRPVDYNARIDALARIREQEARMTGVALARELSQNRDDGWIKLYVIYKALNFRKANRLIFEQGEYVPLEMRGEYAAHACAFARRAESGTIIVAVPRLLTRLISGSASMPYGRGVWESTAVVLPGAAGGETYRNVFTGENRSAILLEGGAIGLLLSDLFACFPLALMEPV